MTHLLDEEDQQLTLKILEAEEKRKCILREKKKTLAGLDEMKRLNERSRLTLRKEKEALETEKAKRLQVECDLLPEKKQRFELLQRDMRDAQSADNLLEKELEIGRKKIAAIRQRLEEQQQQLAQARGQLDQGHRERDSNQARKLLQVRVYFSPFSLDRPVRMTSYPLKKEKAKVKNIYIFLKNEPRGGSKESIHRAKLDQGEKFASTVPTARKSTIALVCNSIANYYGRLCLPTDILFSTAVSFLLTFFNLFLKLKLG